MSNLIKRLAGQTALYGLSSMLGRAANFLLVPIYTALLHPAAFGVVTELYAYVAFLNIVYLYGLETGYFRFAKKEGYSEPQAFTASFSSLLVSTTFLTLVFVLLSKPIASLLLYPNHTEYIILLALILATDSASALPFARLRWQQKPAVFAFLKLFSIFLNIGLNLLFLWVLPTISISHSNILFPLVQFLQSQDEVYKILLANFIGNAAPLPFLWRTIKGYQFSLPKQTRKDLLSYCIPLLWMGLAGMVNEVMDRVLLKYLLTDNFYPGQTSLYAVGVYGACYKLSMFMTLAIQSFRYAADPFFFSKAADKNAPAVFAQVMTWFVISCLFLFLLVSIFLPYFGLLLRNPAYREGLYIVPYLLLANLFLGIYYNLSMWYKLTDKTIYGTYLSIIGAVITIVGNVMLIPFIGYFGSAITTLLCYGIMAALSWYYGQKYYPIPYQSNKILGYIGLAIALVLLANLWDSSNTITDLGLKLALLLCYPIIIYWIEIKRIFPKLS
jgi:O-antigen/teichoic acid export membrane protein